MPDWGDSSIRRDLIEEIRQSRRDVTILFTDIVFSTLHWDLHGDIQGRLMVDQHNRLVFPIIEHYRGQVVKTIGDSVMAMFRNPRDGMRAAIAIQQALQRARSEDEQFAIHVRIGLHSGKAIVEPDDVYGDVVNVASRIEHEAEGDEILVSDSMAARLRDQGYHLVEAGVFTFKGKKDPMTVYRCEWQYCKDLVDGIELDNLFAIGRYQKRELLLYTGVGLIGLVGLYYLYLRYFLADIEPLAMIALNPSVWLRESSWLPWAGVALVLLGGALLLLRLRQVPHGLMRMAKGLFGATFFFLVFYIPSGMVPESLLTNLNSVLYESRHQFIEIRAPRAIIRAAPDPEARELGRARHRDLLVLTDQKEVRGLVWYEVLLSPGRTGWVRSFVLPKVGVPGMEIAHLESFRFTRRDMFALLFALLGFIWGVFDFRIRPA